MNECTLLPPSRSSLCSMIRPLYSRISTLVTLFGNNVHVYTTTIFLAQHFAASLLKGGRCVSMGYREWLHLKLRRVMDECVMDECVMDASTLLVL